MAQQVPLVDPASRGQHDASLTNRRSSVDVEMACTAAGGREKNVGKVLALDVTRGAYRSPKRDFATSQIGSKVQVVHPEVDERARATRTASSDTNEVDSKNVLGSDQ